MLNPSDTQKILKTAHLSNEKAGDILCPSRSDYDEIYRNDIIATVIAQTKWQLCKAKECVTRSSGAQLSTSNIQLRAKHSLMRSPFGCGFAAVRTPTRGLILVHGFDNMRQMRQRLRTTSDTLEFVNVWDPRTWTQSGSYSIIEVCCMSSEKELSDFDLVQLSLTYNLKLVRCYQKHAVVFIPFILRALLPVAGQALTDQFENDEVSSIGNRCLRVIVEAITDVECDSKWIRFSVAVNTCDKVAKLVTRLSLYPIYSEYFEDKFRWSYLNDKVHRQGIEYQLVYISVLARVCSHFKPQPHKALNMFVALKHITEEILLFLELLSFEDDRGIHLTHREVLNISYPSGHTKVFALDELAKEICTHVINAENDLRRKPEHFLASLDGGFLHDATVSILRRSKAGITAYFNDRDCPVHLQRD